MPIHDWSRVGDGIVHDFQLGWLAALARLLNQDVLPSDYYALIEPFAGGLPAAMPTLRRPSGWDRPVGRPTEPDTATIKGRLRRSTPQVGRFAQDERASYLRKQRSIIVRDVEDDAVVAAIEILSPGNKSSRRDYRAFLEKVAALLDHNVHQLLVDLFPPTRREPFGLHAALWEELTGEVEESPPEKPLTLASYEADGAIRAYIEPVAVGEELPDMPLFLVPGGHILVPLEATYRAAYEAVPLRWRRVIEGAEPAGG